MIGLYVHIPFCNQICPYCDFYKMVVSDDLKNKYIDALINEMKIKDLKTKEINTLYIGGGTPSSLSLYLIEKLLFNLSLNIDLTSLSEFTFECNPEDINKELLDVLRKYHVSRLSIGIQTFKSDFQNLINRFTTVSKVYQIVKMLEEVGFKNYSFDLMYGFKNQTFEDVKLDIDTLIKFNPKHISIYSLIVEERTLFGLRKSKDECLELSDEAQANIYLFIIDYLESLGYYQYETSNFSKEGYKSLHNLIYWNSDNYYSLGAGASSFIDNKRYLMNTKIHEYINDLLEFKMPSCYTENLSSNELIEEYIMMSLRKNEGLNVLKFKERFGLDFYEHFPGVIDLLKSKVIDINKDNISINKNYRYVANTIIVKIIMSMRE